MAKECNKDTVYRALSSTTKDYRKADGVGLSLLVKANGVKRWQFDYLFNGKQNRLGLGIYPDTTLKNARSLSENSQAGKRLRSDFSETWHWHADDRNNSKCYK